MRYASLLLMLLVPPLGLVLAEDQGTSKKSPPEKMSGWKYKVIRDESWWKPRFVCVKVNWNSF